MRKDYVNNSTRIDFKRTPIHLNPHRVVTELLSYYYASYVDEPVVRAGESERLYYHRNHQFSITAITDFSRIIKERYAYSGSGKSSIMNAAGIEISSSSISNRFLLTGRELDSILGLHYYRARIYSADLGYFVSRDPAGYQDGLSLHRSYFGLSSLDPSGMKILIFGWEGFWAKESTQMARFVR